KSMGADVDKSITKRIKFVLVGSDPGPKKMEQIQKLQQDGYNINLITYDDFIDATQGNSLEHLEQWDGKNLQLNTSHLKKFTISLPNDGKNILGGAEVFIDPLVRGDKFSFNQLFGYLGAYANGELDDATHILLSDCTWKAIEKGESNITKEYIQNYYNTNRSIRFECSFISESDFVDYYKTRVDILNEDVVSNTFERYLESGIEELKQTHT
ncbi:MAG: hypothetical protein RR346_07000, partial [Bacteroidales bacterium]